MIHRERLLTPNMGQAETRINSKADLMKTILAATLLGLFCLAASVHAAEDDAASLDALLEGLPAEEAPAEKEPAATKPPQKAIVIDGEDIGTAPRSSDPVASIGQQMRDVKQRIEAGDTAEETQFMQKQIVSDLDKLLAQLNKQCSCKNPSPKPSSKPGGSGKPKGGSEPGQKSNKPSAQGSEEGTRQAEGAEETAADPHTVVREAWGHLPQRLREQVQAAAFERFLPQYEAVIEAYYERLAEENAP